MADLTSGASAKIQLDPGQSLRVEAEGGTTNVTALYGAPAGTTAVTGSTTFGPYSVPAVLRVVCASGACSYATVRDEPAANALTAPQVTALQAVVSGYRNLGGSAVSIAFVGDSLTNDTDALTLGPQEYYTHALELAGGRIIWGGKFGQGGMGLLTPGNSGKTWAQTLVDLGAANPRPQQVCLLIGTNDLSANTVAAIKEAYIQAVADIEAMGIVCIVSELPPRNDVTSDAPLRLKLHTFNTWINRWARLTGRRCQHFYRACADQRGAGTWATGLNRDSIHPNFLGARAMAAATVEATAPAYVWRPYLVMDGGDATALANGLMLTDATTSGASAQTAADGYPDSWGKANVPSANFVSSLTSAGTDAFGNWWSFVRDTTNNSPTMRSLKIAAVVGDVIQLGFRFKTAIPTNGSGASISLRQAAGTAWIDAPSSGILSPVSQSITGQQYSVDQTIMLEGVVSAANAAGVCIDYQTFTAGGAGGTLLLGQVTLRNLTQLGAL